MKRYLFILAFSLLVAIPVETWAQINVLKKVKEQAKQRVEQQIDKTIDKSLDKAENEVNKTINPDEQNDQNKEAIDDTSTPGSAENAGAKPAPTQSLESYSKFDFQPGEKVIFFDDFSQENIGDFPVQWNTNGSAEVVTNNLYPGKWIKFNMEEAIWTDKLLQLPDNYTIEFDIIPTQGTDERMAGYGFRLMQSINPNSFDHGAVPGQAGFYLYYEYFGRPGYRTYINSDEGAELGLSGHKEEKAFYQEENKIYHISIWVQKSRVRLYLNAQKMIDLPKAFPLSGVKMDRIRFENGAAMISNIRVAVGAPDTRNKLLTEGKLISYGIYFDINKDIVKPESFGTLKEIAAVLNENPEIKVKIIGHTDGDGADAANLDLSKRRGASVANELVKSFGVDASRLNTDGLGETQPIAPNDSPSNKALNRRVEFIKL